MENMLHQHYFYSNNGCYAGSYDEYEGKLVAAADITAEQFAAYTKAVSKSKNW